MQPTAGIAVASESARGRGYQWNEPAQPGWGDPRRGRQSGARQAADQAPGRGGSRRRGASPRTSSPRTSSASSRASNRRASGRTGPLGAVPGQEPARPARVRCSSASAPCSRWWPAWPRTPSYYHFEGNITSVKVGGLYRPHHLRRPQRPRARLAGTQGPARLLRLRGQPGHDQLRQPAAGAPGPDAHARDRAVDPAGPVRRTSRPARSARTSAPASGQPRATRQAPSSTARSTSAAPPARSRPWRP